MANQQQIQQFLNTIIPMAQADMKKTDILCSLSCSQAILESSWGQSGLTKNANNLYGIKGSYNGQSYKCMGFEEVNGKRVNQMIVWRKYPSWQESINDHSALFLKYDRYKNLRGCTDYKVACQNVKNDGYATSSSYVSSLLQLIQQYKLYQYDNINHTYCVSFNEISTKGECDSILVWVQSRAKYNGKIIATNNGFNISFGGISTEGECQSILAYVHEHAPYIGKITTE